MYETVLVFLFFMHLTPHELGNSSTLLSTAAVHALSRPRGKEQW